MSVYDSNISKNKVDLKHSQYKDIDKRYFDQLIQLKVEQLGSFYCSCSYNYIINELLSQTTDMANKDLDRYYNALDK